MNEFFSEYQSEANRGVDEIEFDKEIKINKVILLNIQKTDTTSVVSYKTIDIKEFEPLIGQEQLENYFIDGFWLKEVKEKSVVFHINLCMFETKTNQKVDLIVSENGMMEYKLII